MDYLVTKGLRAQLKTGGLLTGQLLVELDMHPEAPPAEIDRSGRYPKFTTVPTSMDEITANLAHLLKKLERLPLEQIGNDLRDTISGAKGLMNSAKLQQALSGLNKIFNQTQEFAAVLNTAVAPELKTAATHLNSAPIHARSLAKNLNSNVAARLEATRQQVQAPPNTAGSFVSKDAPLYRQLNQVLKDLGDAARSIRAPGDYT